MGLIRRILGFPKRALGWTNSWFGLNRSAWLLTIPVLLASAAVGSKVGYEGYRYAWIAPNFCNTCHIHDYALEDWRHSIHGDVVTCHDCHKVPLFHYTKTLLHTFYKRPSFPEDLHELPRIPSRSCESCHLQVSAEFEDLSSPMPEEVFDLIVRVDESPAHMLHMKASSRDPGAERGGEGGAPHREHRLSQHGPTAGELGIGSDVIECIDCHGSEANRFHNFFARDENCVQCHEDLTIRGEHLGDFDCRHCHFQDFLPPYGVIRTERREEPVLIKDPLLR